MTQIDMEFSYKGERNYVHGSDIYRQIIKNIKALGYNDWQYFELNIKKVSRHNLTCFFTETKQRQAEEVANFKLIKENNELYGSLIEKTDNDILSRYPFNEGDITQYCHIDVIQKLLTYSNQQNAFAVIDIVISIIRYYLENAVDNSVKWLYRKTIFFKPIDDIEFQFITIKEISRNRRFVELNIYVDDQLVGYACGVSISQ